MKREKIIELLSAAGEEKTSDYSKETCDAILEAVKSNDKTLSGLACLTVHQSLRSYEDNILKHFGVFKTSQDYDDYVNELFIVILSDLSKWDPAIGAITTHFKPRFVKACIAYRNSQGSTFSSTHYELVYSDIKKAKEALQQEGVTDPTPLELRNQIALTKKTYSEQTIINCLEQVKDVSSMDVGYDTYESVGADPIIKMIEQESKDEIMRCILSLEPQHRVIMQIEYTICQSEGLGKKKVTNRLIADEFRRIIGPASDEWIKNIRDAAERDFQHRYNTKRYRTRARVNLSQFNLDEYTKTDMDIRNAIKKDIDGFFSSEETEEDPVLT